MMESYWIRKSCACGYPAIALCQHASSFMLVAYLISTHTIAKHGAPFVSPQAATKVIAVPSARRHKFSMY